MGYYKGIEIADGLVGLIRHMDEVEDHREALQGLQGAWDSLAMLGELSGMGVQIGDVRAAFGELTGRLLNHLGEQARRKTGLALQATAQVAIDILVRNLFERTADIGFLATDCDLRQFAEASAEQRDSGRAAVQRRLREYQRKYSVYQDIVLLAPDGEVLARFDEQVPGASSHDPVLREALVSNAPYLERYGHSDLRPGPRPALIYACRVMAADGRRPVAVLCMCFDFADECERIFRGLAGLDDWGVIALLDAQGRAIASSDLLQLPLGARVLAGGDVPPDAAPGVIRFGGRRWLGLSCSAQGYQGYAGPGWRGLAMVPLEHAFASGVQGEAGGSALLQQLPAPRRAALMDSPQLFSQALREIAPAAERIEAELQRSVWNGNVALVAQASGRDAQFSRTLLREIGRTGARTREVFARAISQVNQTVVSAVLQDSQSRAALAVDIMDRNLYERANDCRWWALTSRFGQVLSADELTAPARDELTGILQTIHGLYTVYANLVVFDRSGCIVAVSRQDGAARPGRSLTAEWVRECLALADSQRFSVSRYEASELYGGALTCIYAAAVRAPNDERRVVGGVAIVFDGTPQFNAMLQDTCPGGAAFGAYVEPDGRVVACSRGDIAPGSMLPADLLPAAGSASSARIVAFEHRLYAVGACRSTGYREYSGPQQGPRRDITALVMVPLADVAATVEAEPPVHAVAWPTSSAPGQEPATIELACFAVAGHWYGLPCGNVLEAVAARHVRPLTRGDARMRGTLLHQDTVIAVFDLRALLGLAMPGPADGPVVVVRGGEGRPAFGLSIDALGEHLHLPASQLERLDRLYPRGHAYVESLVRLPQAASGSTMLQVLSATRLATELVDLAQVPLAA